MPETHRPSPLAFTFPMKPTRSPILALLTAALCFAFGLFLSACQTFSVANPDPAQVAKISGTAEMVVQLGASAALAKNPEARAYLLSVAEIIEQAAAKDAPAPDNLTALITATASKYGGTYGALASLAVQGGVTLYQRLYQANVNSTIDTRPAYKAVLLAMAAGLRSAASGAVAATPAAPPPLSDAELVLHRCLARP